MHTSQQDPASLHKPCQSTVSLNPVRQKIYTASHNCRDGCCHERSNHADMTCTDQIFLMLPTQQVDPTWHLMYVVTTYTDTGRTFLKLTRCRLLTHITLSKHCKQHADRYGTCLCLASPQPHCFLPADGTAAVALHTHHCSAPSLSHGRIQAASCACW